jgi:hypothetical protein
MPNDDSESDAVRRSFLRFRTNVVVVASSVVSIVVGAFIVWAASDWKFVPVGAAVGTSILAVGALALASELTTRRTTLRETFAMVNLRDEITAAGMTALYSSRDVLDRVFPHKVSRAKKIDLMFVSASSWMSNNQEPLKRMLARGGRVRLLVPDPGDDELLRQLLTRFDYPSLEGLRTDVQYTVNLAQGIAASYPERASKVPGRLAGVGKGLAIRRLTIVPTYSFYRVDALGVMRVHEVRKGKAPQSPVLVFERKGTLHNFTRKDFRELFGNAAALERPEAAGQAKDV